MLWSIYPAEVIFGDPSATPPEEVSVAGRTFIVSRLPDGGRRIERLISSDPSDYLRPEWTPGKQL